MKRFSIFLPIFFFFLIFSIESKALNLDKLTEIGYPRTFFYKNNYTRSKVKWFDLQEIVNDKPKYIALIEQNIKVDGEFIDYKFVYSSKHNFFKFIIKEVENKNYFLDKVSFLKEKVSIPEEINDQDMLENEFIESVLDHCTYSSIKNVKNQDTKKKIVFKKFDKCKLKFLNTKNMNDLTLEKFAEIDSKKAELDSKKNNEENTGKKDVNENTKKVSKGEKKTIEEDLDITKNPLNASFMWAKLPYPVISNIVMNTNKSGLIKLNLYETKDECVGTIALNANNEGSWSISCPDNPKRFGVFKKKMVASGTVLIESDLLIGSGFDAYRNKVKFVSKIK